MCESRICESHKFTGAVVYFQIGVKMLIYALHKYSILAYLGWNEDQGSLASS